MESLNALLSEFLKSAVRRDSDVSLIFLKELWPEIVGGPVAAQTAPLELRHRRLLVSVSDDTWKEGLSELRQELLRAVNQYCRFPMVRTIDFQVGPEAVHKL